MKEKESNLKVKDGATEKSAAKKGSAAKKAVRRTRKAPRVEDMTVTFETLRGKKRTTLGTHSMGELIDLLHDGSHRDAVELLRITLPSSRGLTTEHEEIWHVPRVCPAGVIKKHKGDIVVKQMNGLLLLDIQDVYTPDEAARIKAKAAQLPMTVAAFTGSSGMSVKLLVSYWPQDGCLPPSYEAFKALHNEAYRLARIVYEPLIQHVVKEPDTLSPKATFRLSIDVDAIFRPDAQPMPVAVPADFSASPLAAEPLRDIADGVKGALPDNVPPADGSRYTYFLNRFMQARSNVLGRFLDEGRDVEYEPQAYLEALTAGCFELQIPVAEARRHIVEDAPSGEEYAWGLYVDDFYASRQQQDVAPKGKMAQGVREMQRLLASHYEIYRNEVDGALYCRARTTRGRWEPLTNERMHGMQLEVLEAGALTSTKPVQVYLQSDRIPRRNPVKEFLQRIKGRWDGRDHIGELARCVASDNPLWERAFHIWLLGMVRQWMGIPSDHGNDLMPLLCGPQGTGKSTFCRSLLPDELRWGYLDHIDLTKRTELMRLMAQTLLINIDEFDQYRGDSQRGPLKNLLQQVDVRTPKKWHTNVEIRQRLTSFIATCNPTEVLVDETGSRRFICVRVEKYISVPEDFDYDQLYAQAVDEINVRRLNPEAYSEDDITGRCYFTDEEREDVERNNRRFRVQSFAVERFNDCFEPIATRHIKGDTSTIELTRAEIIEYLQRHTQRKFNREDSRQLYAHLERLVDEGVLHKRRSSKSYKYHLKRKQQTLI